MIFKDNGNIKMAMDHFKQELLKAVEKIIEENICFNYYIMQLCLW